MSFVTEYGEMDTGAPMDTAESAKVRHCDLEIALLHLNGVSLALVCC